jgi:hypothetical protein
VEVISGGTEAGREQLFTFIRDVFATRGAVAQVFGRMSDLPGRVFGCFGDVFRSSEHTSGTAERLFDAPGGVFPGFGDVFGCSEHAFASSGHMFRVSERASGGSVLTSGRSGRASGRFEHASGSPEFITFSSKMMENIQNRAFSSAGGLHSMRAVFNPVSPSAQRTDAPGQTWCVLKAA